MSFNPLNFIRQGASNLIDKGKDFANLVQDTNQKVLDTRAKVGEFFAPSRGFEQLNQKQYGTTKSGQKFELPFNMPKKTTIKESAIGAVRGATEIYTGLGRLGEMALNSKLGTTPGRDKPDLQRLTDKFVQTKTGGLLSNVFPKLEEFQKPKTLGEAQAMRNLDIGSFFTAGSTKNIANISRKIAATQDPNTIRAELKALKLGDDVIEEYLPLLIKESDPKAASKLVTEAIIPPPLRQKAVELEIRRQALDESPFNRTDTRFLYDREGRAKELGNLKNPNDIRNYEQVMAEVGIEDPTEFVNQLEKYQLQKKNIVNDEKLFNTDVTRIKNAPEFDAKPKKYSPPDFFKKEEILRRQEPTLPVDEIDVNKIIDDGYKNISPEERNIIKNNLNDSNIKTVKIYRAADDPMLKNGDYVALNKKHAESYLKRGTSRTLIEQEIPKSSLEFNQRAGDFQYKPKKYSSEGIPLSTIKQETKIQAQKAPAPQPKPYDLPENKMPDLSTGEARSLENLALQSTKESYQAQDEILSSLNSIMKKQGTDVKKKVGIIDYVRTPENVFKKVGLEDEFTLLRKSEEAHKAELRTNIEQITNWSKQVPKESNERIFKYLDGQAITLRDDELKVANEIKAYLSQWADRLGLPEDKRVSNYITHLFEDQFIKKEFDEDLAKIIADRIPGSVYDPFLLERMGAKGYKQDVWAALDAYTKRATRKVNLDPALEAISKKANSMEKSIFDYVKRYTDKINMRPSDFDTAVDNTVKSIFGYKLGQRPVMKITRMLRQMAFRGMIGANLGSALRNLSQGINTYAKLGEKYTAIGYYQFARKGTSELKALGVLGDDFITDRSINAVKKSLQKLDDGLFFFFDTAEKVNRGAAFYGARAKALASGKTLEQATDYAKKIVRETQFNYGAIDTPLALQGDINKLILQFLSYPVKQTEFLAGLAKNKEYMAILRYTLGGMAFTYTLGTAVGMKPSELIPFKDQRWGMPPALKLPAEIIKASLNTPDKYGKPRDTQQKLSDVGDATWGIIPGGTQIKKTLQGIDAVKTGGSFDKGGNLQFTTPQDIIGKTKTVLFGKYSNQNAKDYFNREKIKTETQSKVLPTYQKAQQLKTEGKTEEAKALVDSLSDEEWEIYKDIRTTERSKQTLLTKQKILPTYQKAQQLKAEGKVDEANALVDTLSEEEWDAYKSIKKQVETDQKASQGIQPGFENDEPQTPKSVINTVTTYAKAIGVDPVTAFNRIFTNQKIRYVSNGTIVVERLSLDKSQAIKEKSGQDMGSVKLDHTIPLQLGGSNSESNLNIVPTEIWNSYTPVENAIGKALRENKISKQKAQQLIKDFKSGSLTQQQVTDELK
jgi:hypothetical protein